MLIALSIPALISIIKLSYPHILLTLTTLVDINYTLWDLLNGLMDQDKLFSRNQGAYPYNGPKIYTYPDKAGSQAVLFGNLLPG